MSEPPRMRPFGSTGRQVALVGQGSWRADEGRNVPAAIAALRRGLDLGMTHLDTAEMYGSGAAEKLVGSAIEGRRDEVFLVSKVLPSNASRDGTIAACERSLKRLRTDRLDCYLLHWRGNHPLEETVAAFNKLVADGKIITWGVSNFDAADLAEVSAMSGAGYPACNQVLYHLKERAIEHRVLPWCAKHDCALVAYTPFGETPAIFSAQSGPSAILQTVAAEHDATPRQVALAFLLRKGNTFVIPKASNLSHVDENAGAANLLLTDAEVALIDAAFPRGKEPRGIPMLVSDLYSPLPQQDMRPDVG